MPTGRKTSTKISNLQCSIDLLNPIPCLSPHSGPKSGGSIIYYLVGGSCNILSGQ